MTRWLRACALLVGACIGTAHAAPLDTIRAQLADAPVLRGRFEQVKRVEGFRNPLRSSGGFVLARERGVIWDTQQPFPSTIVLTRDRLLSEAPGSERQILMDRDTTPALAAVNALLMALVAGQVDVLADRFTIEPGTAANDGWHLVLTPNDAALQRAFVRIELSGDRYVRRALIEERNGDRSDIRLLDTVETPAQLEPSEAARFD